MAQLTDDCFAFSGPLLPIADAERLINERVEPVAEIETVPLLAARGRVVARDVVAPLSLIPEFDLDALVAQITDDNRHEEVGTGPALGGEFS